VNNASTRSEMYQYERNSHLDYVYFQRRKHIKYGKN